MADGQIVIDVNANTGKASKELIKLQNQLAKIESKSQQNASKKSAIEQQMESAQRAIEETKEKLETLKGKEERFKELSKGTKTKSQQMEYMDLYSEKASRATETKALNVQYDAQLKAYEALKNKAQQLAVEEKALNDQLTRQKGLIGQQEANDARQGANALRELKNEAGGTAPNFKKLFTTILKYGLGIRSLYILFRKLKQVVKESFTELAKTDAETKQNLDSLKTSLAELKGSFGAAFAPIINMIIPWLVKLIDWLSTAMNAVQQFFAVLSGKGTYKKAIANMNAVSGAAGALKKQLMGFDEINRHEDNNGGGGGGSGYSYIDEAINGDGLAAQLALQFKDVFFDWSDLNAEKIVKKAIVGLGAVLGAVAGFRLGGVPGAIIGSLLGIALTLFFNKITFNGDGKVNKEELQKIILAGVAAALGVAIGALTFGVGGAILGGSIGLILGTAIVWKKDEIKQAASDWVNKLKDGIRQKFKESAFGKIWDMLMDSFKKAFGVDTDADVMVRLGVDMANGLIEGLNSIGEAFATWWETTVKPWFTWEKWQSLGAEAIQGMKDGFAGMASSIKLPSFSFSGLKFWEHARGGIVTRPTLFGSHLVGEAGREAIIPLENHTEWIDKVATKLYDAMSDNPLPAMANGFVVPPNATGGINDIMQALQNIQTSFEAFRERGINVDVTSRTYLDGREMSNSVTKYQKIDSRARGV